MFQRPLTPAHREPSRGGLPGGPVDGCRLGPLHAARHPVPRAAPSTVTPVPATLRPRSGPRPTEGGGGDGAASQPELGRCGACAPTGMFRRGCSAHVVDGVAPTGEQQGRHFRLFPPSTVDKSVLTVTAVTRACTRLPCRGFSATQRRPPRGPATRQQRRAALRGHFKQQNHQQTA